MSSSSVLLKIALLGDGAVGKTSLRKQYMGQGFHTSHNMTIGADFANLKKEYPATTINYQVWDLAGQQRFQSMRSRFYNGMQGGLCVFDINRLDSFKSLNGWIEELWRHNGKGVVPITILGNKSDLRGKNSISVKDIEKYVNSLDE
ncbi:MAG: GTP-binding protein, partial [Candidatus Heimdallarchaeota archaeon]|nr:GTP-binding protein [Candidatus Heimdallarchaeota archaeon]